MARRLIVTGAGGFVAGSVIRQAPADWELHALSGKAALTKRAGLTWHTLDLLDADRVRLAFHKAKPDAVIHTAAAADIDYCQAHQDLAYQLNVDVTRALRDLSAEAGAKIVFCSTDTVFDGQKGNYAEHDPPRPINYYAETKVAAEHAVAQRQRGWVIARLSLVVGFPILGAGNSFLARMIPTLASGKTLAVPQEEIRTPIDVITLGRALLELAGNDLEGFIHLAGNDALNRLDMTQRIADRLGYPRDLVVPKHPDQIKGRAPRPRDASLNNAKARAALQTPMRGLDEGLDLVLAAKKGATP